MFAKSESIVGCRKVGTIWSGTIVEININSKGIQAGCSEKQTVCQNPIAKITNKCPI